MKAASGSPGAPTGTPPPGPLPEGVTWRAGEPMARHSPWRVGGPVDAFVVVHRRAALPAAMSLIREAGLARTVLGAGTRTVLRDGGLAGAVLRLGHELQTVEPVTGASGVDGVWVGAGAPLCLLAHAAGAPSAWRSLARAPGSVGASVLLDPGWDPWIDEVHAVGRGGERAVELADLRGKGGGSWVLTRVRLRARPHGGEAPGPGRADPTSVYEVGRGVDIRKEIALAALAGVRLRDMGVPSSAPEMVVHRGGGTARDLGLLLKSCIERLESARGVKAEERIRWLGRP